MAQHSRDSEILISIKNYFGCGSVNKHSDNALVFRVSKLSDFTQKIIPFFDKYPLLGTKAKDCVDFKQVALLIEKKAHLTPEGLEQISKIKAGMNRARGKD